MVVDGPEERVGGVYALLTGKPGPGGRAALRGGGDARAGGGAKPPGEGRAEATAPIPIDALG